MTTGLKTCGDPFEAGKYFLPTLMGTGDALKAGMTVMAFALVPGART